MHYSGLYYLSMRSRLLYYFPYKCRGYSDFFNFITSYMDTWK